MPSLSLAQPSVSSPSKALHVSLWVAQVLLGLAFLMAGFMKTTAPYADLAAQMPWAARLPVEMVRFIGVSEFLGAVGLLLPSLLRIKPWLTPLAASGLATIMLLAIGNHLMNAEAAAVPFNVALGGVAAFIAWGRFKKAPIAPRG